MGGGVYRAIGLEGHTLARKLDAVHNTTTTRRRQMPRVRRAIPIPVPVPPPFCGTGSAGSGDGVISIVCHLSADSGRLIESYGRLLGTNT